MGWRAEGGSTGWGRVTGLGEKSEEGSRLQGRERGTLAGAGAAGTSNGDVGESLFTRVSAKPKHQKQGKSQSESEWKKHVHGVRSTPYHPCPRHL